MIEVKNLVKRYSDCLAVDHLNFTLEPGRIYGFLGPNGAGKSTTMNIMTGYIGATEGEVIINGHSILEEPEEAKRCIGYLPELPPLYMDMKVREYLEFVAELKKVKKELIAEEVDKAENLVKIKDMESRLIKNLSKGYKQRVGLAQAVLGFPEIIILDEPTVGLDPKQIIEIRSLIRNLSKDHTVILSSHILAEVQEVCDYVMIIAKGKMVASDTPENLEKLVEGSNSVEITAKAEKEKVEAILKGLSFVEGYTCADTKDGMTDATVELGTVENATENAAEELSFAFADQRIALVKVNEVKLSLEDVFLELTGQNAKEIAEDVAEDYEEASQTTEETVDTADAAETVKIETPEEAAATETPEAEETEGQEEKEDDSNL